MNCQLSTVNCELFWLASPNLPRSYPVPTPYLLRSYLEPSGLLSRIYSIPFGLLSPCYSLTAGLLLACYWLTSIQIFRTFNFLSTKTLPIVFKFADRPFGGMSFSLSMCAKVQDFFLSTPYYKIVNYKTQIYIFVKKRCFLTEKYWNLAPML